MNNSAHKRFYLYELKVVDEKFYVDAEEVVRVDIYGTVVYTSYRYNVTVLKLDDGTGIIQCVLFPKPESSNQHPQVSKDNHKDSLVTFLRSVIKPQLLPQLGDLVHIRGRLNIYRAEPQIIINNIRLVDDANEEWFRIIEIEAQKKRFGKAEKQSCNTVRNGMVAFDSKS